MNDKEKDRGFDYSWEDLAAFEEQELLKKKKEEELKFILASNSEEISVKSGNVVKEDQDEKFSTGIEENLIKAELADNVDGNFVVALAVDEEGLSEEYETKRDIEPEFSEESIKGNGKGYEISSNKNSETEVKIIKDEVLNMGNAKGKKEVTEPDSELKETPDKEKRKFSQSFVGDLTLSSEEKDIEYKEEGVLEEDKEIETKEKVEMAETFDDGNKELGTACNIKKEEHGMERINSAGGDDELKTIMKMAHRKLQKELERYSQQEGTGSEKREEIVSSAVMSKEVKFEKEQRFKFHCPYCNQKLSTEISTAGRRFPCPRCRKVITIPQPVKDQVKEGRDATGIYDPVERLFKFRCPVCLQKLSADTSMVGWIVKCPRCNSMMRVPVPLKEG